MRPEHVTVLDDGDEGLAATVDFSEYLGGTRYLYCNLSDGQPFVAEQREGPDYKGGERIRLVVPQEKRRYFGEDGLRIN